MRHRAAHRQIKPGKNSEQRGLTRPVLTNKTDDPAGGNGYIDPFGENHRPIPQRKTGGDYRTHAYSPSSVRYSASVCSTFAAAATC